MMLLHDGRNNDYRYVVLPGHHGTYKGVRRLYRQLRREFGLNAFDARHVIIRAAIHLQPYAPSDLTGGAA